MFVNPAALIAAASLSASVLSLVGALPLAVFNVIVLAASKSNWPTILSASVNTLVELAVNVPLLIMLLVILVP